ncbi:deoxyribonucleoside regulator [Cytobacillus eiseniae]|uniref:Deoxyribonucleoside regulator n=1 Tax=Cytobacillus eiseniae TaxID=762947 RepID=A0ABS4R9M9_9BACI|nr:sugar-binding transcriptional regulator [Cytobacillus eiseniae]MBP2239598.1 deoxyribonucleoside regulator [Cytobacillus eiseniae]
MDKRKTKKIVDVAKMYYLLDFTQSEIAEKMGISRPTVSRLLQLAKSEGIVKIDIMDPSEDSVDFAKQLEQKFGLKKAIIASIPQYEDHIIKNYIGEKAAIYLNEIVKDNDIIGVTWGTTLYHIAIELKQKFVKDVNVIQLKGGVSHSETNTYASEILYLFGKAFNTVPRHLPLPAIVDHVLVKQAMEADRHIQKILDLGKEANIALFTSGPVKDESLLFQLGYFTEEDLEMLQEKAVGDICARFFDINGELCNRNLNDRTLGVSLEDLKTKEYSILCAGGAQKIDGIYGALKGKYANVLITDQYTAQFLLAKD